VSSPRRLSQLLVASHLGALLLFVAFLLASGVGTIRTAVIGQARTEAERAITESRKRLLDWHRELSVAADLLAEQPTLRFYLETGQLTKARELVRDFHATSDLEYLRVEWRQHVLTEVGPRPPQQHSGLTFERSGATWRVFRRTIPDLPDASIIVAGRLGDRLRPVSDFVAVELQPAPAGPPPVDDEWASTVHAVADSGEPTTIESIGDIAAARIVSLRNAEGAPAIILSASVGTDWVRRRLLEWYAGLGVSVLVAFLLALGLAMLVGSRIARPFARVADDAQRLGDGDLQTAVPRPQTFLAEPVRLAESLEKMRTQVASSNAAERQQREELDTVLDGVDEGIAAIDNDGRIHYANRQLLELVKRSREEVVGRPLDEIIEPLDTATETAQASALPALERFTAKGVLRPLTVRRLPASGDRQVLVVREENALEAARAMRDRILANLSHEFQTPLSAQIASIELLRDHLRHGNDAVTTRLVDAQYRGTVRLSQLVENLLDSVRIESGEMRLRRQRVDLVLVVEEAIALMQPLLDLRSQRIEKAIVRGPTLIGDAQRLHSVLVNLLANANKFSHTGSTIWIEMDWSQAWATVSVEDQGPGLPPSLTVRDLFAPFRRAPDEEPSQRGSGLGLAIVHAVVAAHGGQVRVDPPRHGGGARIAITLPLEGDP
jgi:signal transduction histidine kinase